jgi:hypothetical protein
LYYKKLIRRKSIKLINLVILANIYIIINDILVIVKKIFLLKGMKKNQMEKFEKNKNRAKNFVMEIIFGYIYII